MEPVSVTVDNALKATGLGKTTLYRLIGEGKLETIKIGRRTLIKADSIRALINGEAGQ